MAIASLALVTLLGLIPQGMKTMIEAGDIAITARIQQQVLNELQLADFDEIEDTFDDLKIFYDSQGEELGDSEYDDSVEGDFEHVYTARVTVPKPGGSGNSPKSVGGERFSGYSFERANSGDVNESIVPVIIEIAAVGGRENFDWDLEDNFPAISAFQTMITDTGRNKQ